MKKKGMATEADFYAGRVLKRERESRKMSQSKLGRIAGVRFQQIQKYENGKNRLSVGVLHKICRAFGCSPAIFFPGQPVNDLPFEVRATFALVQGQREKAEAFNRVVWDLPDFFSSLSEEERLVVQGVQSAERLFFALKSYGERHSAALKIIEKYITEKGA